jgi:anti-anti-sigma regulatory factor
MLRHYDGVLPDPCARPSAWRAASAPWPSAASATAVPLEDALRVPRLTRDLQLTIWALLLRGQRDIVLDLAHVTRIDAAGVGELIRAYNMTVAAEGSLRIVHATTWVREVLERVQLFDLLSGSVRQVANAPDEPARVSCESGRSGVSVTPAVARTRRGRQSP